MLHTLVTYRIFAGANIPPLNVSKYNHISHTGNVTLGLSNICKYYRRIDSVKIVSYIADTQVGCVLQSG